MCWITGGYKIYLPIEGLLPQTGIESSCIATWRYIAGDCQLSATFLLNLVRCDITYLVKEANRFGAVGFDWACIPFLHFMPPSKSFIMLCSHPTHYFEVNCKYYRGKIPAILLKLTKRY